MLMKFAILFIVFAPIIALCAALDHLNEWRLKRHLGKDYEGPLDDRE